MKNKLTVAFKHLTRATSVCLFIGCTFRPYLLMPELTGRVYMIESQPISIISYLAILINLITGQYELHLYALHIKYNDQMVTPSNIGPPLLIISHCSSKADCEAEANI